VAAAPGGDAVAATTVLATTTVAEALGRLMVDGVARGVEHVRSSLLLSVGEIAISAALRTLDAALAFRAMASHGGRQELLLEQFESQRRRPRGAPPPPARAPRCSACEAEGCTHAQASFGLTRHRHHCAHCGGSFCAPHVRWRRSVAHKFVTTAAADKGAASGGGGGGGGGGGYEGGGAEVRVCWQCVCLLERELYENTIAERLCRCSDFIGGHLPPYVARVEDSNADKVMRLGAIGLHVAKSLPLSTRASAAVYTLDTLRKYGRIGLLGIMLKDDLLGMISTLRAMEGGATKDKSTASLAAALYYLMARRREARGNEPEAEAHAFRGSRPPSPPELHALMVYAPIALYAVYCETLVEMQRLGATHGYQFLFGVPSSSAVARTQLCSSSRSTCTLILATADSTAPSPEGPPAAPEAPVPDPADVLDARCAVGHGTAGHQGAATARGGPRARDARASMATSWTCRAVGPSRTRQPPRAVRAQLRLAVTTYTC
jgi:hypothetical protein